MGRTVEEARRKDPAIEAGTIICARQRSPGCPGSKAMHGGSGGVVSAGWKTCLAWEWEG